MHWYDSDSFKCKKDTIDELETFYPLIGGQVATILNNIKSCVISWIFNCITLVRWLWFVGILHNSSKSRSGFLNFGCTFTHICKLSYQLFVVIQNALTSARSPWMQGVSENCTRCQFFLSINKYNSLCLANTAVQHLPAQNCDGEMSFYNSVASCSWRQNWLQNNVQSFYTWPKNTHREILVHTQVEVQDGKSVCPDRPRRKVPMTFVRSSDLSCVQVQTFVRFSVFPDNEKLNARQPRLAFIWVWTYRLPVWDLNLGIYLDLKPTWTKVP